MRELHNIGDLTAEEIADFLEPFLKAYSLCSNRLLNERILEKIFHPILEDNVKKPEIESEDDGDARYLRTAKDGTTYIDYVLKDKEKLSRDKEIKELIRSDYEFPGFSISKYAEEHIFEHASSEATKNGDKVYALYDFALKLEPVAKKKELTFEQKTLMNKASSVITKKMQKW